MPSARTTGIILRMLAYGALAAVGQILLALAGVIEAEPLWAAFWYTI